MTDLLSTLAARGFVQDATPGLAERLRAGPRHGLRRLRSHRGLAARRQPGAGDGPGLAAAARRHTPIALVGGGTGMVGDPSGKRAERPMLSLEQIDRERRGRSRGSSRRFLAFEGANAARMRNNADWLRGLRLLEFLRDTGKHFTLSYMLQKESVRSRLETGISFTEFSYMLIQAYDFWHLYRTERLRAADGRQRPVGQHHRGHRADRPARGRSRCTAWSSRSSPRRPGRKFGKSEGGNVWLDPERTSPYQFYQFWLNTDDRDVERYLKLFTFLRLDQIARDDGRARARIRGAATAQRVLAREVTATVHGEEAAEQAVRRPARPCSAVGVATSPRRCRTCRAAGGAGRAAGGSADRRSCWWRAAWRAPRRMPGGASRAGVLSQRPADRAGRARVRRGRPPGTAGGARS